MSRLKVKIKSYADAKKFIGENNMQRKIAPYTVLRESEISRAIVVTFHATDIVTFHANGKITLKTGGYRTMTTKEKMNLFLPDGYHVYSKSARWFVSTPNCQDIPFQEGFVIGPAPATT